MIAHAVARLLHALADRIEPDKPKVEIQYVYVYSSPPVVTTKLYPQSPFITSPNVCGAVRY